VITISPPNAAYETVLSDKKLIACLCLYCYIKKYEEIFTFRFTFSKI